jgi:hypothetical protein
MDLPKRKDGTTVSPWDDDHRDYYTVRRGLYIPVADGSHEAPQVEPQVLPEPVKTGELIDPGFVKMFIRSR